MEFMEALNQYGWTVYYFAGFSSGVIISLFVGILSVISDCFLDVYNSHREVKRQIKAMEKAKEVLENAKKK